MIVEELNKEKLQLRIETELVKIILTMVLMNHLQKEKLEKLKIQVKWGKYILINTGS